MKEKLRITYDDLANPHVDEVIEHERAFRTIAESGQRVGLIRRLVFSSMFYSALVGIFGAFIGWMLIEPFFDDVTVVTGSVQKVLPNHVLAICEECMNTFPVLPENCNDSFCPECNGKLSLVSGYPIKGIIKLNSTDLYVIPQTTWLVSGDQTTLLQSANQVPESSFVRGEGFILDKRSLVALNIEIDPANVESYEPDLAVLEKRNTLAAIFWFAITGGIIALMIGAVEGIVCLNLRQAIICGGIGMGIGFAGGLLGIIPAGLLYAVANSMMVEFIDDSAFTTINDMHGLPFFMQIVSRSLAWGVVGMSLALGQGIVRKSKKMVINGLLGGCIGGLLGGLLFDPLAKLTGNEGAELSRCVGLITVGFLAGLLIGLVEQLSKEAWLLMKTGPLAGKQFIVYKHQTTIGSSPKCDIYLFKDRLVGEEHARLVRIGRTYELEGRHESGHTLVNGVEIQKRILRSGDLIKIGSTELEYRTRGY